MSNFYKKMGMDKRQKKEFNKAQEKKLTKLQGKDEPQPDYLEQLEQIQVNWKVFPNDFIEQIAGKITPAHMEFLNKILGSPGPGPVFISMPPKHGQTAIKHACDQMDAQVYAIPEGIIIIDDIEIDAATLEEARQKVQQRIEEMMAKTLKTFAVPPGFFGQVHACSFGPMAGNKPQQPAPWDHWAEIKPMPDGSGKAACSVCGNRFDVPRGIMQTRGGRGTCEKCGHACSIFNDYKRKA